MQVSAAAVLEEQLRWERRSEATRLERSASLSSSYSYLKKKQVGLAWPNLKIAKKGF